MLVRSVIKISGMDPISERTRLTMTTYFAPIRSIILPIKGRVTSIPTPWGINASAASIAVKCRKFWKNKGKINIGPMMAIFAKNNPTLDAR
ncbi:hypothetical protein D3C81_820640 [compost metagenome]